VIRIQTGNLGKRRWRLEDSLAKNITEIPDYQKTAMREGWMKPATQQRSLDMAERILEAAFQVFSAKGYRATKISDVATLADCSVGIFYKRFADKEGLFFTLQHRHFSASRKRFELILEAKDADVPEVIFRGFVQRSLKNMLLNTGFIKAQIELALTEPRVAKARLENIVLVADKFMQVLVPRGELPDTKEVRSSLEMAVRVVYATITHIVLFGPGPYPLNDKRVVDNLTEVLVGFLHEEKKRLGIG
jgi:AcrR family transcriptional regulator